MKLFIIVCLLVAGSMAVEQNQFKATLTNLVNMQARAVDAVDSALDLLRSLQQANIDAQAKSDALNRTQEQVHGENISEFTALADQNKANGDAATEHRKHVQEEIRVTQEYLVWINNRRQSLTDKKEKLREQRCYANLMFIKALKEHDEALEVVRWLREDILGVVAGSDEEVVDFAQIKDASSKLSAYAHLFTQNQMNEFAALSQDGDNSRQAVDTETAEWDQNADDNTQGQLELERMGAGTESRDVGQKILDAVDRLEEHLEKSIKDLEACEIRAAWDLSQWLQDAEAEHIVLDQEQASKVSYLDNLLVIIDGVKAREDQQWEIYFESAATLNTAIQAREALRQWWAEEKARRDEENNVLDQVIAMFLERVSTIDKNMRTKVNDHAEDGVFDDSDISRSVDDIRESDGGQLQSNVAAESRQ